MLPTTARRNGLAPMSPAVSAVPKARTLGVDMPLVLWMLVIAAAYVVFAKLGFSLAFATQQITAVWPPTGIAVAALLLFGRRIWPGIWLGAFISNAITHEPVLTAAGVAVGNTLGPIVGVYLLRRFVDFDPSLQRLRDVVGLVIFCSALGMMVTATNGVLQLALVHIVPWSAYPSLWRLWWIGDAMGVLLVAPLILTWAHVARPKRWRWHRVIEIVVLNATTLVASSLLFLSDLSLAISLYPLIIWSALRFHQRATTLAIAIISMIAIWGTVHGLGPFSAGSFDHRLTQLVSFMGLLSLTGLVLGSVTAERRAAAAQLEVAERRFQLLAEIVPQMVWTSDATGWIDWYNHRWYEYTGQTPGEAAGWGWQRAYHPEDFPRVMQDWPRSIATGAPFEIESRIRRADGTFRWFLLRAAPLRNASGAVVRWYGTNTDIDDQKRLLQRTAQVAEDLQTAFLPGRLPVRPDLRFDALYLAAQREALVGGDWYDAFELPDGSIVVSIGDVVGHGVGAAVTASRIRQAIFTTALDSSDPAAILAKVNRTLRFQENTLATALVAVVDPNLATIRYATAGHPPPIVAGPHLRAQSLPYGGVPLGVETTLALQTQSIALERDAVILFYTDGVTEFKRDIASAEQALRDVVATLVGDVANPQPAAVVQRAVMGTERPADDAVIMVLQLASTTSTAPVSVDGELRKTWAFHSSDAYAARALRHELMRFIRGFIGTEDELFRIELIIGEILANTVEHAPGLVKVEIDRSGDQPTVTIVDTGPGLGRFSPTLPNSDLVEKGRGLFLIGTLAGGVRVESSPNQGTKMTVILSATPDDSVRQGPTQGSS